MPGLVSRVLSNIGCNPIKNAVRLLKDVTNRHSSSTTKGAPNVRKERVCLGLLHLIPNLSNDGSRVPLNKNPLCPQLLPGIDDAHLSGSKLSFRDRRLEKV